MLRQLILGTLILAVAALANGQISAQDSTASQRVEAHKVTGIVTVWSMGRAPAAKPSHTYILTHGQCGVDDRFFKMGQTIAAQEPQAIVLVPDWSVGATRTFAKVPNPAAVALRIDLTGDMLGMFLVKLAKDNRFDPMQTTFIGESFGNCVNHRTALVLRQNKLQKPERALVLNPAPSLPGYEAPLFTVPFKQSIACVTDSCLDTRQPIANKLQLLRPTSRGAIETHTFGMTWLQEKLDAGEPIASHFVPAKSKATTSNSLGIR